MEKINRRQFISQFGLATAAMCVSPRFAFAKPLASDKKIRLGVVGGNFGLGFFFHEHPNCIVEAVSDLDTQRRNKLMEVYQCKKSYESLEKLLRDPKVEAVALFTPAPDHVRHTIQCLKAGKHVLCAVPAAMNEEECYQLFEAVKRSGLTYMMAETTTYREETMMAQEFYRAGKFGNIFSSAAQYYHPGLETLYFDDNKKPTWRHGLPPMLYPTHVTSFLIAVTGERLVSVACNGWGDGSPLLNNNPYGNPFWNETALFRTDKGNSFMGEVCWRGALVGVERGQWHGDKMSYYSEYKGLGSHQVVSSEMQGKDKGGFVVDEPEMHFVEMKPFWKTGLPGKISHISGHGNSHCFITHEFISSLVENRKPGVDVHEALAYTIPGIIAHKSAMHDGELLKIPVFD